MKRSRSSLSKNSLEPRAFALLVLVLFSFGFFSYYFLTSYTNPLSGAETSSGTVSLNILANVSGGAAAEEEEKARLRNQGKLLSLELEILPKFINEHLDRFQGKLIKLTLRNRSSDKTFELTVSTRLSILTLGDNEIILPPGAEKTMIAQIDTSQVGTFIGEIIFEGLFAFKQIPVFVQIAVPVHYTVDVTIPSIYQEILPGQDIFADIVIQPLQGGQIDITYTIKNENGNTILEEQEQSLATQPRLAFQKTFDLPDNLPLERYYLIVSTDYANETAEDAAPFDVVSTIGARTEYPFRLYSQSPLVFFLIVLAIILLHILMTRYKKK